MRNFRRFLAMTLSMLMVVGCLIGGVSAAFEDVTDFQNEITILTDLGIIKGKADGTYGFDEAVTRRQMSLFMARSKTGKVDDTVWTSSVNNSQFVDLDATNDYYGAISYCANLSIIIGRTKTQFYPNDNIILQEAITMAVRALGYGSEAMDKGYPYTFYDKAVSLGLDDGIEDVALTDVVSRGVAAKLIYNMLFCVNANGVTMAEEAFGATVKSTTVVLITGGGKNLSGYNQPTAAGTVSFCEINADGSFNTSIVYNLKWSSFVEKAFAGDDTKNARDYVGASFDVVTIDGFKTLSSASCNPFDTFDQDAAYGAVIDEHTYTLVDKWSKVFNTGTTWSGGDELMKFNTAFTSNDVAGVDIIWYNGLWVLVDANNNILESKTHQILFTYMGNDSAWVQANGTIYAKYINGAYYPVTRNDFRWSDAATVDELDKATYSRSYNASKYTTNVNSYSDTVAYDDDNDGLYERAYFTYYIFGRYYTTTDNDGVVYDNFTVGATGGSFYGAMKSADTTKTNISGKELTSGSYILWARDGLTGEFIIKKIYDAPVKGYVTAVDTINDKITLNALGYSLTGLYNGTTLNYGVAKLPGATATNTNEGYPVILDKADANTISAEELIGVKWDLQFQVIQYVVDEDRGGHIVAIVSEKAANTPVVIDSYQGYTTLGYLREQVVLNDGTLQIINISKINDYPLFTIAGYGLQAGLSAMSYFGSDFSTYFYHGELLVGSNIDQLGGTTGNWMVFDENYNGEYYQYITDETNTLTFWNGISYEGIGSSNAVVEDRFISSYNKATKKSAGDASSTKDIFAFTATKDMVLITPASNGGFIVAKGIPANGAMMTIPAGAKIYVSGQYIYILPDDGQYVTFNGIFNSSISSGWNTNTTTGEDIVYFAGYKSSTPVSVSNSGDFYNQYGSYYMFTGGYWSLLTGKANGDVAAAIYSDNALLTTGFYTVKNMSLNGATVKAFDKKVAYSDLPEDVSENLQIKPTYLINFGTSWALELKVADDGTMSLELTRAAVSVYDWVGGTAGRNTAKQYTDMLKEYTYTTTDANGKVTTHTAKKGVYYLALEYSLLENDTNYIPSTSKFYYVIDVLENADNSNFTIDQLDTGAYDVNFSIDGAGTVEDMVLGIKVINNEYVLGYYVTTELDNFFAYDDAIVKADNTEYFIPISAFDGNKDYVVGVKLAQEYSFNFAMNDGNWYSVGYYDDGVLGSVVSMELVKDTGVWGYIVTTKLANYSATGLINTFAYDDNYFTNSNHSNVFIPLDEFDADTGIYDIGVKFSAKYQMRITAPWQLERDATVTTQEFKTVNGVLGFYVVIDLPSKWSVNNDNLFYNSQRGTTIDGFVALSDTTWSFFGGEYRYVINCTTSN